MNAEDIIGWGIMARRSKVQHVSCLTRKDRVEVWSTQVIIHSEEWVLGAGTWSKLIIDWNTVPGRNGRHWWKALSFLFLPDPVWFEMNFYWPMNSRNQRRACPQHIIYRNELLSPTTSIYILSSLLSSSIITALPHSCSIFSSDWKSKMTDAQQQV